jgi:hypothetical protein
MEAVETSFEIFCGGLPAEGFEPPTYGLQNRCTTTVLSRRINSLRDLATSCLSA